VSALRKLAKQLRPDGTIVFSVPNMANFATRLELLAGRFEYTAYGLLDQTHLHYYDRVELEKVFTTAGFKVTKYNDTLRDIPRSIIEGQLKKLGLHADEKFWKLSEHIDSTTFQFIGTAKKGSGGHATLASKTPHDFMSEVFDKVHEDYGKQIAQLKSRLSDAITEASQAKQELSDIKNSKGWHLLEKYYRSRSHLTKKK
jgi:O-antigen biosynthesis protein